LRHHFAFRFSSILGARGHQLLGLSLALIVISISTPPLLFFNGKWYAYPFRNKKGRWNGPGRLNIHFAKWIFNAEGG
jgi:hypothetical protein